MALSGKHIISSLNHQPVLSLPFPFRQPYLTLIVHVMHYIYTVHACIRYEAIAISLPSVHACSVM